MKDSIDSQNSENLIYIKQIDEFLAKLSSYSAKHIRVSYISQTLNIQTEIVRKVLIGYVSDGILKQKFRFYCPTCNCGVQDCYMDEEIPSKILCDYCNEEYDIDINEIIGEIVYELL